ncbi:hypothetical protein [Paraburkholderia flava]|uniref:hypothetical protein n=1 Tax=Paraburkholderia flava TaxID=2547393 RepID=UPI00105B419B|nr:hypothetical protein [Paraburkholderia flava]
MTQTGGDDVRLGSIGVRAPLYVIVPGALITALFAALYAVVIRYNPLVYFSFIGTLLFGVLTGFVAVQTAEAGQSRSRLFNLFAALVLALFGLWCSWLIWIMLAVDHGGTVAGKLALEGPSGWLDFIWRLAENDHVSVSRRPGSHAAEASTQTMLWIWSGEAFLIVAMSLAMAWVSSGMSAEAERARKAAGTSLWVDVATVDATPEALSAVLQSGDFSILHTLVRVDPKTPRGHQTWENLTLELIAGFADDPFRAISIDAVENRRDSKGAPRKRYRTVVHRLPLPTSDYDALVERLHPVEQPVEQKKADWNPEMDW